VHRLAQRLARARSNPPAQQSPNRGARRAVEASVQARKLEWDAKRAAATTVHAARDGAHDAAVTAGVQTRLQTTRAHDTAEAANQELTTPLNGQKRQHAGDDAADGGSGAAVEADDEPASKSCQTRSKKRAEA
jgi:hypothetical protein